MSKNLNKFTFGTTIDIENALNGSIRESATGKNKQNQIYAALKLKQNIAFLYRKRPIWFYK